MKPGQVVAWPKEMDPGYGRYTIGMGSNYPGAQPTRRKKRRTTKRKSRK